MSRIKPPVMTKISSRWVVVWLKSREIRASKGSCLNSNNHMKNVSLKKTKKHLSKSLSVMMLTNSCWENRLREHSIISAFLTHTEMVSLSQCRSSKFSWRKQMSKLVTEASLDMKIWKHMKEAHLRCTKSTISRQLEALFKWDQAVKMAFDWAQSQVQLLKNLRTLKWAQSAWYKNKITPKLWVFSNLRISLERRRHLPILYCLGY